jgi:cellulose biosynthesis protein BcsQ
MAHGGGRGWFHRRKPRPEPEPVREPEPTRLEAFEAERAAQVRSNGESPPVPAAAPAAHSIDASSSATQVRAPVSPSALNPSDSDERYAPPSSAPTSLSTVGPAPEVPEPEHRTSGYDWDAATAAALSDDTIQGTPTGSTPPLPHSSPDKLLEDIIREIVGDATAETVSTLHQPKPTPVESEPTRERTRPDNGLDGGETEDAPALVHAPASDVLDESVAAEHVLGAEAQAAPTARPEPETASGAAPPLQADSSHLPTAAREQTDGFQQEAQPAAAAYSSTAQATVVEPTDDVSRETFESYGGTPLADQIADETRRRLALEQAVLPLPPSTRILTISNQKGGVGKTTSAVNLAAALARAGAHVLVIDLDPQGNASTALGVEHRSDQQSVYEVLVGDLPISEVVRPSTEHENLDCVPATIHLAGAEIELVSLVAREQRLRRALDAHLAQMDKPYDYVLIDCPPSLGLLTINAFVAAREVLIPIQCEYYALEGLSQLLSNIELIERHLNSDLRLSTILLTMYDSRTNLAQQVAQEVRDHFPIQTLTTIIPRSVRVSEAPSYGQSVISYDFASSGSLSYREAAAEIAWRGASEQKESD